MLDVRKRMEYSPIVLPESALDACIECILCSVYSTRSWTQMMSHDSAVGIRSSIAQL